MLRGIHFVLDTAYFYYYYYYCDVVVVIVTPIPDEDISISTWTSSPRVSVGSRVELRCTATSPGQTAFCPLIAITLCYQLTSLIVIFLPLLLSCTYAPLLLPTETTKVLFLASS